MAVVERVGRGRGARRALPRGVGRGEERVYSLEEAVGVGRQWERAERLSD